MGWGCLGLAASGCARARVWAHSLGVLSFTWGMGIFGGLGWGFFLSFDRPRQPILGPPRLTALDGVFHSGAKLITIPESKFASVPGGGNMPPANPRRALSPWLGPRIYDSRRRNTWKHLIRVGRIDI